MKHSLKVILFGITILFSSNYAFSQENKIKKVQLYRNAIYGTTGLGLITTYTQYGFYSLQYERLISEQTFIKNTSSFLKVGLGTMYASGESETVLISEIQYGLLLGKNINKLELASGLTYYPNLERSSQREIYLSVTVAWRHQEPGKSFFFRIGTGLPSYLSFGIGWSF